MKKHILSFVAAALWSCAFLPTPVSAQVPQIISYQGRVAVAGVNFNGTGSFKFALVNTNGTTTYWSNDGTSAAGSEPTAAVSLTVTKGLYSVLLGDTSLGANMTAIPASVWTNADVRLRVWFNDGTNGSQLLTPDQRIAAVGYAVIAGNVPDGAITGAKIAGGTITSSNIANGAVGGAQLAASSVTADRIASSQVVKNVNGLTDAVTLAPGANITITPSGNTLTIAGSGGGGGVGGSGTTNTLPMWTGATTLGNSLITQSNGGIQLPNAVQFQF